MNNRPNTAASQALAKWGHGRQINKATEECAEFIVAVNHWRLGRITAGELAEEIAGVENLMKQMAIVFAAEMPAARERQLEKLERYLEG